MASNDERAPKGRLELTWTNKHLCLIDELDGSYAWVSPSDHRVSEVRLLDDVEVVGEVASPDRRAEDNLLIEGDALAALRSLTDLPEFARNYVGQVKLAYLDPPFNTGQAFEQYDDALEHSVWLTMMRDRLQQIRRLLRPDGSVWLHLDDHEAHRGRAVLDEVFGAGNYITTIYWKRKDTRANDAKFFSPNTDQIHLYARDYSQFKLNRLPRSPEMNAAYKNPDNDPRGPWRPGPLYAKSGSGTFTHTFRNGLQWRPPPGKYPLFSDERLRELEDDGRIYFGVSGKSSQPLIKQFFAEAKEGVVPTNNWDYAEVGSNRHSRLEQKKLLDENKEPFPTAKPERLMERVIRLGSNPGDIVLDCFAGSGTTAAVAHKMGRRWVAVERDPAIFKNYALARLTRVVASTDGVGISVEKRRDFVGDLPETVEPGQGQAAAKALKGMREDGRLVEAARAALVKHGADPGAGSEAVEAALVAMEKELRAADKHRTTTEQRWSGGGGFRVLRVAPSMFHEQDGQMLLSEWACQGRLSQAVAAQLGYELRSHGGFVGLKGRRRLAVIDGLVSAPLVRLLAEDLADNEAMEVAGRAVADDAVEAAAKAARGSRVRKIPNDLLKGVRVRVGGAVR